MKALAGLQILGQTMSNLTDNISNKHVINADDLQAS